MNINVYRTLRSVTFVVISLISVTVFAQPSKEALDHAREGYEYEQQGQFAEALYKYNQAIAADTKYPYPVQRIAAMYQKLRNYSKAIEFYKRAIALDSAFDDYNYYNLALSYRTLRKFDSAAIAYNLFTRRMKPILEEDSLTLRRSLSFINYTERSQELRKQPGNTFEPVPLDSVNSPYLEFGPAVTLDGKLLYFTSRRPSTNTQKYNETGDFGDDLFTANRDGSGRWAVSRPMGAINTIDDEGASTFSADGQEVYYSLCRRPDGVGDCDIYMSALDDSGWKASINIGRVVNSPQWDGQPSINPDGTALYFSSRRLGSVDGSEDLWVSYRNTGSGWAAPVNLGETINTAGSERSPFIAADGRTLYFSSDEHAGYGEHDLFVTYRQDDGTWTEPKNLGTPINTSGNDEFLTIPARGDTIIYDSDRGRLGNTDLFFAVLPADLQPKPVILVMGTVFDKRTKKPVRAKIELMDLDKDELLAVYQSDATTGEYRVPLPLGKLYGVTATATNYLFYSGNFTVSDTSKYREVTHNIPLSAADTSIYASNNNPPKDPIKTIPPKDTSKTKTNVTPTPPETVVLNNIFFDFDKATLRKESFAELRNVAKMLKTYPTMEIELSGHTDTVGDEAYNTLLSENRAKAVRHYLIYTGGIDGARITAKGYGSTRPVAPNETEEGRQLNRRTEFAILKR